jgi:hypothetical protein
MDSMDDGRDERNRSKGKDLADGGRKIKVFQSSLGRGSVVHQHRNVRRQMEAGVRARWSRDQAATLESVRVQLADVQHSIEEAG